MLGPWPYVTKGKCKDDSLNVTLAVEICIDQQEGSVFA